MADRDPDASAVVRRHEQIVLEARVIFGGQAGIRNRSAHQNQVRAVDQAHVSVCGILEIEKENDSRIGRIDFANLNSRERSF